MPSKPEFSPQDFGEAISAPEVPIMVGSREAKPILIGGQAVNVWAQIYQPSLPSLRKFEPHLSRDADLFGGANMAFEIAKRCGWEFVDYPRLSVCASQLAQGS